MRKLKNIILIILVMVLVLTSGSVYALRCRKCDEEGVLDFYTTPGRYCGTYCDHGNKVYYEPHTKFGAFEYVDDYVCQKRCQCRMHYSNKGPHTFENGVCTKCGFILDTTPPTAGEIVFRLGGPNGAIYTPGTTWTNQNVHITLINGSDSGTGHKSTTYTVSGANVVSNSSSNFILTNSGISKVIVTTYDNANNSSSREYDVKIDKTVPILGTMSPSIIYTNAPSGSVYTASVSGLSDADSGLQRCVWRVKKPGESSWNLNNSVYIDSSASSTSTCNIIPVGVSEGTYYVGAYAQDKIGTWYDGDTPNQSMAYMTMIVDRSAPTIGTVTAETQYTNKVTNQTISITASNIADVGVSGLKSYIWQYAYSNDNGNTFSTYTNASNETNFPAGSSSATINFPIKGEGSYKVRIVVKDKSGNEASKETEFMVDNTKPYIGEIEMHETNASGKMYYGNYNIPVWSGTPIAITKMTAGTDAYPGEVASVRCIIYLANGGLTQQKVVTKNVTSTQNEFTLNEVLDPGANSSAEYELHVITRDKAGNDSEIKRYKVYIDRAKPSAGYLDMKKSGTNTTYVEDTWANTDVYVSLKSPDIIPASGISQNVYSVSGATTVSNTSQNMYISNNGISIATVTTTDGTGESNTNTQIIKIDKTPPNVGSLNAVDKNGDTVIFSIDKRAFSNREVTLSVVNAEDVVPTGLTSADISGNTHTDYMVYKKGSSNNEWNLVSEKPNTLTENGEYKIIVYTEDAAGNRSQVEYYITIAVAVTKTFTINNINDRGIKKVSKVTIEVKNSLGVTKYMENKTLKENEQLTTKKVTFTCKLEPGEYTVKVILYDALQNFNTIKQGGVDEIPFIVQ